MSTLEHINAFVGRTLGTSARPVDRSRNAADGQTLHINRDTVDFSADSVQRGRNESEQESSNRVTQAREAIKRGGYDSDDILDATADLVFAELQSIDLQA